MRRPVALLHVSALALGCGGAQPASGPTTEPRARPAWSQLARADRLAFMREHVVPTMGPRFSSYDAEEFASFGCATCHGLDGAERDWAMPNPGLPPLYPSGTIGQQQAVDAHPAAVRFMFNDVTPRMAELLGQPVEAGDGQGFGCFGCHPHAAEDDPLNRAP